MATHDNILDSDSGPWRNRLDQVSEMMRDMSLHTDPQAMVNAYLSRVRKLVPSDRVLSLSRRNMTPPRVRLTRSDTWDHQPNPWKEVHLHPVYDAGVLPDLIYGDKPVLLNDFHPDPADPAYEYLRGMRSLLAIPLFDQGVAMNMVVRLSTRPDAFSPHEVPEMVWIANLFGRATHALVLAQQLRDAYSQVDRELQVVSNIQRSLLPRVLPCCQYLESAAHYQTSRVAGGDYYDLFPMPDHRVGILIADVSGHGTPAAVVMAQTHAIVHAYPDPPSDPAHLLTYVNRQIANRYVTESGTFVTAFYAVYDPHHRTLAYSTAGHPPPRVRPRESREIVPLDQAQELPLGIDPDVRYPVARCDLRPGDSFLLYTDGIIEAPGAAGQRFGAQRLDEAFSQSPAQPQPILNHLLRQIDLFAAGVPADDDRTLLALRVSA